MFLISFLFSGTIAELISWIHRTGKWRREGEGEKKGPKVKRKKNKNEGGSDRFKKKIYKVF